jgi:glycosyltransferase involved in cell wall biosynthesis
VLESARSVADELLVIDSGSTDATLNIAERRGARILSRRFDNFRDQRVFAENHCAHRWILQLDSDEVLSEALQEEIRDLKHRDFDRGLSPQPEAFSIPRCWYFLGQPVRAVYPIVTPDSVVRLFCRDNMTHRGSRVIHEAVGYQVRHVVPLRSPLLHYTADTVDDLYAKIGLYTQLAAQDMAMRGVKASWLRVQVYPWLIWIQWHLVKGGWRDGEAGRILSRYARDTVYLKYLKLRHDTRPKSSPSQPAANTKASSIRTESRGESQGI